jgi:hypothetical protein
MLLDCGKVMYQVIESTLHFGSNQKNKFAFSLFDVAVVLLNTRGKQLIID